MHPNNPNGTMNLCVRQLIEKPTLSCRLALLHSRARWLPCQKRRFWKQMPPKLVYNTTPEGVCDKIMGLSTINGPISANLAGNIWIPIRFSAHTISLCSIWAQIGSFGYLRLPLMLPSTCSDQVTEKMKITFSIVFPTFNPNSLHFWHYNFQTLLPRQDMDTQTLTFLPILTWPFFTQFCWKKPAGTSQSRECHRIFLPTLPLDVYWPIGTLGACSLTRFDYTGLRLMWGEAPKFAWWGAKNGHSSTRISQNRLSMPLKLFTVV